MLAAVYAWASRPRSVNCGATGSPWLNCFGPSDTTSSLLRCLVHVVPPQTVANLSRELMAADWQWYRAAWSPIDQTLRVSFQYFGSAFRRSPRYHHSSLLHGTTRNHTYQHLPQYACPRKTSLKRYLGGTMVRHDDFQQTRRWRYQPADGPPPPIRLRTPFSIYAGIGSRTSPTIEPYRPPANRYSPGFDR